MIFAVSKESIQWSMDFGPDLFSDCKRSRPRNDNRLPRITSASLEPVEVPQTRIFGQSFGPSPNHANHQATFELREEVLATARTQEVVTSSYELSDLEEVEFFWEHL